MGIRSMFLKFFSRSGRKRKLEYKADLVVFRHPGSFIAEQFKMLRNQILYPASGTSPRAIMVTSAMPGDGKSFVSANLAVSIAENIDTHILLMDCDLRIPNVHHYFGLENGCGLSEYLSGDMELAECLMKPPIRKLTVLPAGDPPLNPAELLSSDKMKALLEEVKHKYDDRLVIIDTPPPNLTAETSVISRLVDGIILVVRYGSTPREMVSELIQQIGEEKIIGIVFNSFDMRSSLFSGYGKYGKYYEKYKIQ